MKRARLLSKFWRAALAITLTLLALGLLIRQILRSPLATASFDQLEPIALLWPLLTTIGAVLLSASKWHTLLGAMEQHIPWRRTMRALLVAWPYAAVTPSRAGDLVRAWVIKDQVPLSLGGISVVVDRLLDVQSLLILATIGSVAHQWWWSAAFFASPIVAIWAGVVWAKQSPISENAQAQSKLAKLWQDTKHTVHLLAHRPAGLLRAGALSLCTWLLVQSSFYLLNQAFSSPLAVHESFGLWPIATLLGLAPITLAGMGTRDLAFVVLLAISREQIEFDALNTDTMQALVESSGHYMLATVAYTALSSWLFAIVGLPWTIREWTKKDSPAP